MKRSSGKILLPLRGVTKSIFPRRLRGELQLQDRLGNVLLRTTVRGGR